MKSNGLIFARVQAEVETVRSRYFQPRQLVIGYRNDRKHEGTVRNLYVFEGPSNDSVLQVYRS